MSTSVLQVLGDTLFTILIVYGDTDLANQTVIYACLGLMQKQMYGTHALTNSSYFINL